MRSRLRSAAVALTIMLAASGGMSAATASASAAQQTSLTVEAPAQVATGWSGDFVVSGFSDYDSYDYVNVEISGPGYDEFDYRGISYGSFRKSFDFPSFSRAGTYEIFVNTDYTSATTSHKIEVVAAAPAFQTSSVSRSSFYPTVRDGFQDSVTIRWRPNGRLPVEMYVLNDRDRKVMQWPTQTWRPYQGGRVWYGKDSNGNKLPKGRYRIRMIARGADGRTATRTLGVRINSDVITKRTSQRWYGNQTDRRRKRGDCYMNGYGYDGTLNMDCWDFDGGSSAHAEWWFRLPSNARNIRWGINGSAGCCDSPGVIKKSSRRQGRKFIATMDVSGFRSYTVNRAWVGYTYKKRR